MIMYVCINTVVVSLQQVGTNTILRYPRVFLNRTRMLFDLINRRLQTYSAYASSGSEVGLKSNQSGYPESRIVITSDKFLFLLALKS